MKIIIAGVLLSCLVLPAEADTQWLTFKSGRMPGYGRVQYQIDPGSVRQQGLYKIFSARVWVIDEHQALAFNNNEQLFFLSRKYAVNCEQRRFGSRFIDSNSPKETRTSLQAMRWDDLDTVPAVGRIVCGDK